MGFPVMVVGAKNGSLTKSSSFGIHAPFFELPAILHTAIGELQKYNTFDHFLPQPCKIPTMSRAQNEILLEIDQFKPGPADDWREMDALLSELWQGQVCETCLPFLFRVFERFPHDDGAGVLWGIVHGIESTDLNYEQALRDSLSRQPSELGQIMLHRIDK
ncbi:hypothetical protein [Janthinobacterium sp. RB2R34]|uniref:hypothetical protein n=1 Tax=Janthinobacterium sp. RB2R34 TaxID=3424193 RepID=UPI003F23FCD7